MSAIIMEDERNIQERQERLKNMSENIYVVIKEHTHLL
jgi:predicted AAA+ superfamily ATPase